MFPASPWCRVHWTRKEVSAARCGSRRSVWRSLGHAWLGRARVETYSSTLAAVFLIFPTESRQVCFACAPEQCTWIGHTLPSSPDRTISFFPHSLLLRLLR